VKRIIYDVPRWSVFLHRTGRGLDPVGLRDWPLDKVGDELFERLYAGDAEALSSPTDDALVDWARGVHDGCSGLPEFQRLQQDCAGDPDGAAVGVETLLEHLAPSGAPRNPSGSQDARRQLRIAASAAADAVDGFRDAVAGLVGVAGTGVGTSGAGQTANAGLVAQLKVDPRLKRIAQLAGRMKRVARASRRNRTTTGAEEIMGVEPGGDLGRLLPQERALLVHPRLRKLALRGLLERSCLQYALAGSDHRGSGPIVLLHDKSTSMSGERDVWATAVALALLDLASTERRTFLWMPFNGAVIQTYSAKPGERIPMEAVSLACSGGTDIATAITTALERIAETPNVRNADVILVTDAEATSGEAGEVRKRAGALGSEILGVQIGDDNGQLRPWCDAWCQVGNLNGLSDEAAALLFTRQ